MVSDQACRCHTHRTSHRQGSLALARTPKQIGPSTTPHSVPAVYDVESSARSLAHNQ